jgi:hypothetical protein
MSTVTCTRMAKMILLGTFAVLSLPLSSHAQSTFWVPGPMTVINDDRHQ